MQSCFPSEKQKLHSFNGTNQSRTGSLDNNIGGRDRDCPSCWPLRLHCTWQSRQYTQTFTSFGINYPFSPTSISSPPLQTSINVGLNIHWKTGKILPSVCIVILTWYQSLYQPYCPVLTSCEVMMVNKSGDATWGCCCFVVSEPDRDCWPTLTTNPRRWPRRRAATDGDQPWRSHLIMSRQ